MTLSSFLFTLELKYLGKVCKIKSPLNFPIKPYNIELSSIYLKAHKFIICDRRITTGQNIIECKVLPEKKSLNFSKHQIINDTCLLKGNNTVFKTAQIEACNLL